MDDRTKVQKVPQQDRQSKVALKEPLPSLTAQQLAEQEAANTLLQYDRMVELINSSLASPSPFRLRQSIILELNRISIDRIEAEAGRLRNVSINIEFSQHQP
ncbi:MAG TPA: hypothetical protein VGO73_06580, partial [Pyrinomonadaceae bacterium]|nr:hypothetical protein [Pyrinomonadaceae bacterium]